MPPPASPRKGPGDPVGDPAFGSLKPYKGADVLVRAGLLLARHRRDFRITICGKAFYDLEPLRAEIAAAGAADLIRIEARHQSEQELGTQLEEADLVVFPYREIDASGPSPAPASSASRSSPPISASSPKPPSATISACCRPRARRPWRACWRS